MEKDSIYYQGYLDAIKKQVEILHERALNSILDVERLCGEELSFALDDMVTITEEKRTSGGLAIYRDHICNDLDSFLDAVQALRLKHRNDEYFDFDSWFKPDKPPIKAKKLLFHILPPETLLELYSDKETSNVALYRNTLKNICTNNAIPENTKEQIVHLIAILRFFESMRIAIDNGITLNEWCFVAMWPIETMLSSLREHFAAAKALASKRRSDAYKAASGNCINRIKNEKKTGSFNEDLKNILSKNVPKNITALIKEMDLQEKQRQKDTGRREGKEGTIKNWLKNEHSLAADNYSSQIQAVKEKLGIGGPS